MSSRHTSHALLVLALSSSIPTYGCGSLRKSAMTSNVSSSVHVNQTGRDIATVERGQYELLETSTGADKSRRWFILWFPVGHQATQAELESNAAYNAVAKVDDCDEVLLPHTKSRRVVIPLLLVNVVINKLSLRGRCISLKTDKELSAQGPTRGVE